MRVWGLIEWSGGDLDGNCQNDNQPAIFTVFHRFLWFWQAFVMLLALKLRNLAIFEEFYLQALLSFRELLFCLFRHRVLLSLRLSTFWQFFVELSWNFQSQISNIFRFVIIAIFFFHHNATRDLFVQLPFKQLASCSNSITDALQKRLCISCQSTKSSHSITLRTCLDSKSTQL